MAKELSRLFVAIGIDDSEFGRKLNDIQKNLTQAGKMMTGLGVGITAALGLSVKAAEEERINIARLDSMLQNVGTSYDQVSVALEENIAAMQRKTGIADDQQRNMLSELVFATGDYEKALELLPTALDLMAAKQMDAKTAAELLGKVAEGQFGSLSRYGIVLKEGATASEALAAIQEKVAGSAEKMASPINILKASFGDLVEKVGANLLPVLQGLVEKIMPIIESIGKWMDENPELSKTLIIIVAAVGGLMAVLGPLLMMLPMIAAGFTLMLGPVGLIIAAVVAVAAGAALLIMNWEKVGAFFEGLWEGIVNIFKGAINLMIGYVEWYVNTWIKGINLITDALSKIQLNIPDWVPLFGGQKWGINIPDIPEINLPRFDTGGIVPGPMGAPMPILAHGGEIVSPSGQTGVNIHVAQLVVREEADVEKIARKLYRMQQVRI